MDLSDEERLRGMLSPAMQKQATDEKDKKIMSDVDILRTMLVCQREANRQGFRGTKLDAEVMCSPFGFKLEDIRKDLPVQLWYGKKDVFVPPVQGEEIARRIGGKAVLRMEDDTHTSISVNWKEEQIKEILKAMSK